MVKKSVQILFSDEEFRSLEKEAIKCGLTVPLYIKGQILKDSEFDTNYKKLINKVEEIPAGTRFTIQLLFGIEWTMSRGLKLSLGKTYYKRVKDGTIVNVKPEGKDSSNVMWYVKL